MAPADAVFVGGAAFLFGVLGASLGWNLYLFLALSLLLINFTYFTYFAVSTKRKSWVGTLIFLIPCALGFFYYYFYFNLERAHEKILFSQKAVFSGIVIHEPKRTEKTQLLALKLNPPYQGTIRMITADSLEYRYGDELQFDGVIEWRTKPDTPTALFPKIQILKRNRGHQLMRSLIGFKRALVAQIRQFLPSDSAALLSGITFGVRSDFSKELKEAMVRSGTTHLTALSGYNIVILVSAISTVFGYWLRRKLTFYLTTLIIIFFVLMVGGEASIVRAAVMGFLVLLAGHVGRLYSMRNALVLTAVLMIVQNPAVLTFDLGFQLSFLSLLGIVYLGPALKNYFAFDKKKTGASKWKENIFTTFSAQLAVAPFLIHQFGEFSSTSLLANILILGLMPLTMFFGFFLSAAGLLSYYVGTFIGWLTHPLLGYELIVIRLFSRLYLPFTTHGIWILIPMYYLLLIVFITRYYAR